MLYSSLSGATRRDMRTSVTDHVADIIIVVIIVVIQSPDLAMSPKRRRAAVFEIHCQWPLLIVQVTTCWHSLGWSTAIPLWAYSYKWNLWKHWWRDVCVGIMAGADKTPSNHAIQISVLRARGENRPFFQTDTNQNLTVRTPAMSWL